MASTDSKVVEDIENQLVELKQADDPDERKARGLRLLAALLEPLRRRARKLLKGVPSVVAETDDLVHEIREGAEKDLEDSDLLDRMTKYPDLIRRFRCRMNSKKIDLIRRRDRQHPFPDSTGAQPVDEHPEIDDARKRQTVLDAIEALPMEQRGVVELVFLKGMKNTEAARELGVDESTIRRRLNKAFRELRPVLEEFSPESSW